MQVINSLYIQMQKIKKEDNKNNVNLINLGLIISLGNCCIGYTGVCLSAIQHILKIHNRLSQTQTMYHLSISTSSLNLGAIIGALLYKKFQDKFGTLKAFTIVDILCIFFILIQLIDLNVYFLSTGRFLYGMFMTMSLAMTPGFLNKMSRALNPSLLGTLGSFNQLLIVFGMIISYMMAYILPKTIQKTDLWTSAKWRIYIGLPLIFIFVRLHAILTRKQYKQVEQINYKKSMQLLGQQSTQKQLQQKQKLSYRKRLIVGIVVIASNQLSCINGIFFYAKQMMDLVTDNDEELSKMLMLFLAFGQLLASMMSGKLLSKYGRKSIFIKGQLVLVVILILCFFLDIKNPYLSLNKRHFLIGVLINLHVVVFNLTLGPICIFYCSQILDDLKYVVMTLKITSLFFALTSDFMIHYLGIGEMFLIFGIISLFLNVYLNNEMQQTMNLDKQEIYNKFSPPMISLPSPNEPETNPLKCKQVKRQQQNPNNNSSNQELTHEQQQYLKQQNYNNEHAKKQQEIANIKQNLPLSSSGVCKNTFTKDLAQQSEVKISFSDKNNQQCYKKQTEFETLQNQKNQGKQQNRTNNDQS